MMSQWDIIELLSLECDHLTRLRPAIDALPPDHPSKLPLLRFVQRRITGLDNVWLQLQSANYIAGRA